MSKTFAAERSTVQKGGDPKHHAKNQTQKKHFARKRIELLCDPGTFIEDGLFANATDPTLPADGVITGFGKVDGRVVALLANDSTVKAGSWGALTVEKILRLQEKVSSLLCPVFYLIDSAGARITDQVDMFPGRRGAGKIFYNQCHLSGKVPQICVLLGPSAAGGAYVPSFCDVVIMVEGNASMYLGSPRMAESVIGEKVTLEEMGGARLHCTQSGCGDILAKSEEEAFQFAKKYFSYLPQNFISKPKALSVRSEKRPSKSLDQILPESESRAYDIHEVIEAIVDPSSFFELKENYAKEIVVGFARLEGQSLGIIANQPMVKGGVLFAESSNKAARFIQVCSAFGIPLLFLADVPGFMIGSKVEKEGIIRAGAKMVYCVSNAKVPKISVILRKAYGAGLYAMCGPAFGSDCVLALPSAKIAVMGAEPAINAVYYNKLQEMKEDEKKSFMAQKKQEYEAEVDILKLASKMVVDDIVEFSKLRETLVARYDLYSTQVDGPTRMPGIFPM